MDTTRGERGTRRVSIPPGAVASFPLGADRSEFFSPGHETHLEARALVERREVSAAALGATMALEAVIACMIFI